MLDNWQNKYFVVCEAIEEASMETKEAMEECQEAVVVSATAVAGEAAAEDSFLKACFRLTLNCRMNCN